MRGEEEKQELREAQEVTHDLEEQENKEVLQQSATDQTRRWSKGNGIGSSNTTGKGESQQDPGRNLHYGENSLIMIYIPHLSKNGWAPWERESQDQESGGEGAEKERGTIRKCPFLWGDVDGTQSRFLSGQGKPPGGELLTQGKGPQGTAAIPEQVS